MSSKSWYSLKSKAVHTRYGLTKNIQVLLQGLESFHAGIIDARELGSMVRLSPKRRESVAATIAKCARMINKDPQESKTCVDIIEMCTEILEIADRPPPIDSFPFMRLPAEIREHIVDLMVDTVYKGKAIKPGTRKVSCNCPKIEREYDGFQSPQMKALPSILGPALNQEFFRIFFRKKTVRFRCCCELLHHLDNNPLLVHNVRDIKVHWCGPTSATAFKKLVECDRLESLTISISKSTLAYLSPRTDLMKTFFPLTYRHVRITDILGLDELLAVRGLKEVAVIHAQSKSTNLTVETDRANLSELLTHQLKKDKKGYDPLDDF
ncbi:hypothetical protein HYE67_007392 [Fusarium culmorum]|uniref:Uncharacterized protein n=2 Tax=Fusarium sambucinum species complex TaxID=569360 RepID=A0A7S8DAS9_FUSCU|nr:hypothetical protein FAUST_5759 [Fusarium austroamericanum]KAI6766483.1 hypothetical protein HG531_011705 [Fusarium graminearum]QPC65161.1 hypothetical protein HYE67_007392 [Fusarium culmorum]CAF3465953.1 unnamed protein product [Fusarium graminearum]CAG1965141.1 unnamed protein product [Fusarium graminearum]